MALSCTESLGFNPHEFIGSGNPDAVFVYGVEKLPEASFRVGFEVSAITDSIVREQFPEVWAQGLDEKDEVRRQINPHVWQGMRIGTRIGKQLIEAERLHG